MAQGLSRVSRGLSSTSRGLGRTTNGFASTRVPMVKPVADPLHSTKNYNLLTQEQKMQSLRETEQEQRAQLAAVNAKATEPDDRNFLEKWLNMDKNQGFIGDTMELLGRPMKAVQASFMDKNPWEAFTGQQKFTTEDFLKQGVGIDVSNQPGLLKFAATLGADILTDPLTFWDEPIKLAGKGIKWGAKQLGEATRGIIETTERGKAFLQKYDVLKNEMSNKVKEMFNTYKNQEFKDFNARTAGHANALRAAQEHSLEFLKKTQSMIKEDAEKIFAKKDAKEFRALGLKRDASKEEVHAAYKGMIMQSLEQAPKDLTQGDVLKHVLANRTEDGRGTFLISSTKANGINKVDREVMQPLKEKFEKWLGRPISEEEMTVELGKEGQGAFIKFSKNLMDDVEKQMGRYSSIEARYKNFGLDHQTLGALNELATTGKVALHLNDPVQKALYDKLSQMFKGVGIKAHGEFAEVALTRRQLMAFIKNPENADLVAHLMPYLQRRAASGRLGEAITLTPEERTKLAELDGVMGDLPADQRTQFILDELEGKPQYKTMRDKLLEEQKAQREAVVKEMTARANQTNNYALKDAYTRLAALNQDLGKATQQELRYKSAIENINKRVEELKSAPFEGEKKIEYFNSEIERLNKELETYRAAQDTARKEYKSLQRKSVKLNKEFDDLMNAVQTGKVVPKSVVDYPDPTMWMEHVRQTIDDVKAALQQGTQVSQETLNEFKKVIDTTINEYGIEAPKYVTDAEKQAITSYITQQGYELNQALREGLQVKQLTHEELGKLIEKHYKPSGVLFTGSDEYQINLLDRLFSKATPSKKNIKLTRMMEFNVPEGGTAVWTSDAEKEAYEKFVNAQPGDILEDAGYQSTSAGFGYYGGGYHQGAPIYHDAKGLAFEEHVDDFGNTHYFNENTNGRLIHENDIEKYVKGESTYTNVKLNIHAPKGSKMLNIMNEIPEAVTMQEVLLNRGSKFKVVNVRTVEEGGMQGAIELDVILMDGDYAKIAAKDTITGEAVAQADKVKVAEETVAKKEAEITRNQVKLDNQLNAKKAAEGVTDAEVAKVMEDKKLIETKLEDATQAKEQLGKEVTEADRKVKEPLAGENRISQQQLDTVENIVYKGLNVKPEELKVYAVPTNRVATNNIKVLNQTMQELEDLAKEGFLTITPTKVPKALLENSELRVMDITRNLEGVKQQIYATANLFGNSKLEDIAKEMNIDGYMRHIANQDTILWKRLEKMGADNPETAKLISSFYKNGTKDQLTMNRKWLGSAQDINKSLGIELFNTDPIEAMAVMLKIIPERFLAINLIDHALETGLIRELSTEQTKTFLDAIKAGGSKKDAALASLPKEYKFVDTNTINELDRAFDFLKVAGASDKDLQALSEALNKIKDKGIIHTGLYNKIIHYGKTLSESGTSEVLATIRKYFLNPWKKVALFSFGYHGRNFMSNMMNAYLAGIHPASYMKHFGQASSDLYKFEREIMPKIKKVMTSGHVDLKTTEGQIRLINKALTPEEKALYNEMMEMQSLGVLGSNKFSSDYYDMINSLHNVAKKEPGILRSKVKQISDASLKLGKLSDDASRIAAYKWAKTTKGAKHIESIGLRTPEEFSKFAFFDFHDMSPFEERYMKAIFPFYAWARKNFEFHVRNFAKQPKRYIRLNHFFKSAQDAAYNNPDEINKYDAANMLLPMWRKKDGKVVMMKISPTYLDLQDITSGNVLSRLNPLIKAPIEAITGRNTFTKKNMEGNLFSQFGTSMLGNPQNLLYALEGRTDKVDKNKLGLLGQRVLGITGAARAVATGQAAPETMMPSMFKASDTKANELKARENRVWLLNQQIQSLRQQGHNVPTANQLFRRGVTVPHQSGRLRNMQTMSSTFAGKRRA